MTRECGPYSFYWCIGAPRENVFLPLDHLIWRWFFLSHFYFEKYIDYKKEWNYNSYNKSRMIHLMLAMTRRVGDQGSRQRAAPRLEGR
jgi:hypothetical protein